MENQETATPRKAERSVPGKILDVLSGFGLATISLLILGFLTWFATLEQIDHGLYPTLNKYFHWKALIVIPEINGKIVPFPLPGGYWMGVVLLINLTLGGIIRIRKTPKKIGVIISHFGIVYMLIGGGVAHHFSERGNMAVGEGVTSNVAEDYFEYVVEVAEIIDDAPKEIHVIRGKYLTDLEGENLRTFQLPGLPFSIQLTRYFENAVPASAAERAPSNREPVVDGYYLFEKPREVEAEKHTAAVYGRVLLEDGSSSDPFIVAGASFAPYTYRQGDRVFTIDMRKKLWTMPFSVQLDKFTADFHPGTTRPAKFVSEITRIEDGQGTPVTIQMNEPMRYQGLTFFQASYGPPGAGPGDQMYSVFEVVRNPADKWPEYSLYVVTFGLFVHFIMKLASFLGRGTRKPKHES